MRRTLWPQSRPDYGARKLCDHVGNFVSNHGQHNSAQIEEGMAQAAYLAETYGHHEEGQIVVDRDITYDQIAPIVGATRQWVTQSLDRLQNEGVLKVSRKEITILRPDRLYS